MEGLTEKVPTLWRVELEEVKHSCELLAQFKKFRKLLVLTRRSHLLGI